MRNFPFGPPGSGGFDLASLNIQRGRDHGLPSYAQMRIDLGLAPVTSFADVSSNPDIQARLASVYDTVDQIDPWVGGLCEDHQPGALVGALVGTVLARQFEAVRDGDRFWYQHALPPQLRDLVEQQTLARIIRRNTSTIFEIDNQVFLTGPDLTEFDREATVTATPSSTWETRSRSSSSLSAASCNRAPTHATRTTTDGWISATGSPP